jgi:hypothetical protein
MRDGLAGVVLVATVCAPETVESRIQADAPTEPPPDAHDVLTGFFRNPERSILGVAFRPPRRHCEPDYTVNSPDRLSFVKHPIPVPAGS